MIARNSWSFKSLGFDTAATEVAELVARAFSPITDRQSLHENDIEADGDDREHPHFHDSEASESESLAGDPSATSNAHANGNNNENDFGKGDGGFMGNILRIIGLDNGKLSALAVNGLIFIAQIVSVNKIIVLPTLDKCLRSWVLEAILPK